MVITRQKRSSPLAWAVTEALHLESQAFRFERSVDG